jgi:hypothetical protein
MGKVPTKWPQNIPNDLKMYPMAIKYTKWQYKYQHFLFQGPPKYAQIAIFGVKICTASGNPDAEEPHCVANANHFNCI